MLDRRTFASLSLAAAFFPARARAQAATIPFYDAIGPDLSVYGLDVASAALSPRGTVTLPANLQYAWPHPTRRILYTAASNGVPGNASGAGAAGDTHVLSAFAVDPGTGALTPLGPSATLTARPIHICVDEGGAFVLAAYNAPSHISVHRIEADGSLGEAVAQDAGLDFGIYAHQLRVTPGNKSVVLVTRGNAATAAKPEDPGAIKVFGFAGGKLTNLQSLQPAGSRGYGFGPRHVDFHPTLPFVYVSVERNNRLDVYRLEGDGRLSDQALFQVSTLSEPAKVQQTGPSAVHVHPGGRFVYLPNRGSLTVDYQGRQVSNGGYNSMAVFALDPVTGEPRLIQQAEAHGFELRTFTIDPSGSLLIAASSIPMLVRDGDAVSSVNAGLSFYRIGSDGRLTFLRKQDVDSARGAQFWCGFLTMP